MRLPRLWIDFNSRSLDKFGTKRDRERQHLELYDGMPCIFYQEDESDDQGGYLHGEGTVSWDADRKERFAQIGEVRFTPASSTAFLDDFYA